jgi:hypothetical protein
MRLMGHIKVLLQVATQTIYVHRARPVDLVGAGSNESTTALCAANAGARYAHGRRRVCCLLEGRRVHARGKAAGEATSAAQSHNRVCSAHAQRFGTGMDRFRPRLIAINQAWRRARCPRSTISPGRKPCCCPTTLTLAKPNRRHCATGYLCVAVGLVRSCRRLDSRSHLAPGPCLTTFSQLRALPTPQDEPAIATLRQLQTTQTTSPGRQGRPTATGARQDHSPDQRSRGKST